VRSVIRFSGPSISPGARSPPRPVVRVRRNDRVHGARVFLCDDRGRLLIRATVMMAFGPKTPGDRGLWHECGVQP